MTTAQPVKILVIKLGALGDFIQALGPMKAIRAHHPEAHITILTTSAFREFATQCGYFNDIWLDTKPKAFDILEWLKLRKKLNDAHFSRVYDLQNNDRTSFYFKILKKTNRPEWVGVTRGASHRNTSTDRTVGHAFDGHVQTLALAGIKNIDIDTLDWLQGDLSAFKINSPYILLVPGSAPSRPEKRWPAAYYAKLCTMLHSMGFQPVLLGTAAEKSAIADIVRACPGALDISGQTSLAQVATLARGAAAAIGNDTGPLHLIAATQCPVLALFSGASNPEKHAPKGTDVQLIKRENLKDLTPEEVIAALKTR
jgi:ADP-heptose:LPS heptosyltransferase